ncbi:hypothetical protein HBI56_075350 [Parastagonospora nodorum]|uniref:Uncharacterized protein n=1 Tax=Phaeosphaeria nodorum (strain SN15 / ATCC MYA-4574 / FGSC 10173) TaxID=321614 RepID=A0A7U2HWD7_PHANO|nr:hypothetical protein HBH56_169640 [Parastagonospora nodorum]QRC94380.1 hypothetical protein JI435_430660 [Parastagonospora nodorum SN15]KAH3928456.1 hypothetical protein HBH54_138190 [Parastagonospora nodorum]KAH3945471.1 hypothetical protein HBH53_143540 [Parastagonospora nodorum]KAH3983847.1 hypothetical protein HBH52_060680 [Parastagonospora nodorum]
MEANAPEVSSTWTVWVGLCGSSGGSTRATKDYSTLCLCERIPRLIRGHTYNFARTAFRELQQVSALFRARVQQLMPSELWLRTIQNNLLSPRAQQYQQSSCHV